MSFKEAASSEESLQNFRDAVVNILDEGAPAQAILVIRVLDEVENVESVAVIASRGTRLGMKGLLLDAAVRLDDVLLK